MRKLSGLLLAAVVTAVVATPAVAQRAAWQNKWFWGAQGGLYLYETPTQPSRETAWTVGGHWMITTSRTALDISVQQLYFDGATTSSVVNGASPTGFTTVSFTRGRLIQAVLNVVPIDAPFQPYLGVGFSINYLTNAIPIPPFATPAEQSAAITATNAASTSAFAIFAGGLQLRVGRLAIFGQYQYMPSAQNFLITSEQHNLNVGIRYALTGSEEAVTTER